MVLNALRKVHNDQGVLCDTFLERSFSWHECAELHSGQLPYRECWVGFLHNPPGIPKWHDYASSPQEILGRNSFKESLPYCVGLITLSRYLADWLQARVEVPVLYLPHPTEIPVSKGIELSPLVRKRTVVQIGWWLRRQTSIYRLKTPKATKYVLKVRNPAADRLLAVEIKQNPLPQRDYASVSPIQFVGNAAYDRLLTTCVVFCDLYDSSANNTIIECIARNTPIVVNRLPAVEEYLGEDYPLLFDDLEHAGELISDENQINAAIKYLKEMQKSKVHVNTFMAELFNSPLSQALLEIVMARGCF